MVLQYYKFVVSLVVGNLEAATADVMFICISSKSCIDDCYNKPSESNLQIEIVDPVFSYTGYEIML